jgi:hypothetical protein
MFVTIITDCSDSNALGRQMTRSASLFGFSPVAMPISHQFDVPSDLEAGCHLIDVLDSCRGSSGVILLNKAPLSSGKMELLLGIFGIIRLWL